ncbi:MAG: peptide chain release factor 1, partial [Candidatus Oxydemutatoraceae bacterium WSBS_2016_MAG_OTU14]
QERAQLEGIVIYFNEYEENQKNLDATLDMLKSSDNDMKQLAQEEAEILKENKEGLEEKLKRLLIPTDPHDDDNIFLEIRAGTGGDEAAIFVGDLLRMYTRYAAIHNWQVEILTVSEGEHGGYKEVISRIEGKGAYSHLKFESGTHRVQRIPETESQGRVHTSASTVAILPEAKEIDEIDIDPSDLRIDTFRASGAGGQHVNKTDSAIRITHLPTSVAVECQENRSQHRNKAQAMTLLKARLLDMEQRKQNSEQAEVRRNMVGSGDRSERIRTYNFPQGRVTDHRINLTLYQLEQMMEGDIDMVVTPLINEHQLRQLSQLEKID